MNKETLLSDTALAGAAISIGHADLLQYASSLSVILGLLLLMLRIISAARDVWRNRK